MSGGSEVRLSAARRALAEAEAAASTSGLRPVQEKVAAAPGSTARPGATSGETSGASPGSRPAEGRGPDPHDIARKIVLRQLAMGPRTRSQLEDKLRDRDCDPHVAARVLDRMTQVGLVDDEAYAEMFVHAQQETKGLAVTALRHEMRRKGLPDEVVDAALEGIDPEHEKEQARALVSRRLRTMRGLDREVQTRRLAGLLARKGYGAGVSYELIQEALDELPEHRRD